jgi:hypothetical protein
MIRNRDPEPLRRAALVIATALLALGTLPAAGPAVSFFGVEREPGREPAETDFDDIWFYHSDRSKQIPDVSLQWIAVAFRADAAAPLSGSFESDGDSGGRLLARAGEIVREYEQIVDVLCDRNLAEDACFFLLREGLREFDVKELIRKLGTAEAVGYAHPALVVGGRTVAYFDAFQMTWKTSAEEASRQSLMEQAHVFYDDARGVYRVDVMAVPFFKAVNLLAEDVRVLEVTPVLVPLEPPIRAGLSVPLQGCQLGDRIPFSLRIDFTDRIRIDPSSLVNVNLRPEGIQKELIDLKFDPYDYVKASSQSPVILTGSMRLYAPGAFVLPEVEIRYECTACSGERVRSIRTEAVPLQVASIVPAKAREPEIVIPAEAIPPVLPTESYRETSRKSLGRAVAFFALAAVLLGAWGRKWAGARKAGQGENGERREEVLAQSIRARLEASPEGPHWVYAGDTGRLLREYLVEKYGPGAEPLQGSGEVFLEGLKDRIPAGIAARARPLFLEIDRMIATETVDSPELSRWRHETLAFLDLTRSAAS